MRETDKKGTVAMELSCEEEWHGFRAHGRGSGLGVGVRVAFLEEGQLC